MKRDERLEKAAEQLADLLDGHLSKLPESEREAKSRALHQAVARIGTDAKASEPQRTPAIRRAVRRRA
jgi:hypothetical protein